MRLPNIATWRHLRRTPFDAAVTLLALLCAVSPRRHRVSQTPWVLGRVVAFAMCVAMFNGAAQVASLHAQTTVPHVDNFTVEDGLLQNVIKTVVQDRTGFIWVGTSRGLQRFDGYSFVPYAALNPEAPNELSQQVDDLRLDAEGSLWIKAAGALFTLDANTHRLSRLPAEQRIHAWTIDDAGKLWVLDGSTQKFC